MEMPLFLLEEYELLVSMFMPPHQDKKNGEILKYNQREFR